jgi:UPF0755 protein
MHDPADGSAPPPSRRALRAAVLAVLAPVVVLGAVVYRTDSAPPASRDALLEVPSGTSAARVADSLFQGGHIRSRRWFLWLVRVRQAAGRIRAGVYEVKAGQRASAVLSDLVDGRTRRVRVTVPEGFATWQIAERLQSVGLASAADFTAAVSSPSLEGYLFPETYHFEQGIPPARLAAAMTGRFDAVWSEVLRGALETGAARVEDPSAAGEALPARFRLADGRVWTRAEVVTLASLIEREARREEERPLVSAVYHNRLRKRMPLESDPTVQYSLGRWKERVLFRDLDVDSPYNTYRRYGLPPGPICSPGRSSLAAALAPAPVAHLYFVADESTGGHWFSDTYAEHLRKVRERDALRRERRRAAKERT